LGWFGLSHDFWFVGMMNWPMGQAGGEPCALKISYID
jgi:hypothetical protein